MKTEKKSEMFFADACVCSVMRVLQFSVAIAVCFWTLVSLTSLTLWYEGTVHRRGCAMTCSVVTAEHSKDAVSAIRPKHYRMWWQKCITFKAQDNECQSPA